MEDCLVAFGSNLGDSRQCFAAAHEILRSDPRIEALVSSQALVTRPVGGPSGQAEFLNACFRFSARFSVTDLYDRLCIIEKELGRDRRRRWGPRKIDLDLLVYGNLEQQGDQLVIPHPRMSFRRFVLHPACQIAADMVHSSSGLTMEQLLSQLNSKPDRIVFVIRRMPQFQSIVETLKQRCCSNKWALDIADNAASLNELLDQTKLVVFSEDLEQPMLELARRFPGPTLNLGQTLDLNSAAIEIESAIAAMSSL